MILISVKQVRKKLLEVNPVAIGNLIILCSWLYPNQKCSTSLFTDKLLLYSSGRPCLSPVPDH